MTTHPTATIHLSNIAHNWRALDRLNPASKTSAVVKANAYGHGIARIGETLADAGCDTFFVAYASEGALLRKALGPAPLILVLNGPDPEDAETYRTSALSAIINSPVQFKTWHDWRSQGANIPYALHFDTGMNRLGLPATDAAGLAAATASLPPLFVMSHLACGEDANGPMNAAQLAGLTRIAAHFPGIPLSLANSAGSYLGADYALALTRPGIALYGGGVPSANVQLLPALTLTAPILSVSIGRAGSSVGYGATHTLERDTALATTAIGYADGLPRSLSGNGFAALDGVRCPILGRVSMDLITIDVSAVPHLAKTGERVELIGPNAPLEEQAALGATLGYELITGLGPRVERIYEV